MGFRSPKALIQYPERSEGAKVSQGSTIYDHMDTDKTVSNQGLTVLD